MPTSHRPPLTLRNANDNDCESLTALCHRSKAVWGYDAAFMAQCHDALTISPVTLTQTDTRLAQTACGRIVGVAATRVLPAACPSAAELEMIFVEPAWIGQGVGTRLLEDVRQRLARRATQVLWILSDPGAEAFYLSHGAARVAMKPSDAIAGRSLPWLRLSLVGKRHR